jgi:FkbM family methyltransferase
MQLFSYAQNYEDVRLWRAFRDIERGRYLDIGTQDPTHDSVSRFFYDRGWRGVHVEPTPHYAAAMRDARPDEKVIEAAVSCSPMPLVFFEIPNTGLSTGVPEIAKFHEEAGWSHREILVPTISLASLLDYMGQDTIHWLKIDVEGMEADVLMSWGDHPARPAALVIEATRPNTQEPTHEAWQDMVTGRGYREALFDGLSRYFIHETEAHRAKDLALSPNVFDGFQVLRTHFSTQHLASESERLLADQRSEAEAEAQAYSEQMAETTAAAADASAQLDAALQRVGELEGELSSEAAAHGEALEQAHAAAADALLKLDVANTRAAGLEGRLREQARLHAAALALAKERTSEIQLKVAESKGQLAAIQTEHSALGRLTGRLEGQLDAREQWYSTNLSTTAVQRDELRDQLQRSKQELASFRDLAADLRTQLAVRIARSEAAVAAATAEKEAANDLLGAVRKQARQFTQQAADLTASLVIASQQRDEIAAQVHELSLDSSGLADELEATRREAAESGLALRSEIESLRAALVLRERKIAEAEELFAVIPNPFTGISGLRQALARRLIGAGQLSAMADHQAAALEWQHDKPQAAVSASPGGDENPLDCPPLDLQALSASVGAPMFTDEGPITSVPQLLAPHDRMFIHTAYQSVLGRPPEPEGEAYYLARLRSGVHKLAILKQLRRSPEGRTSVQSVAGLDRAIKRHRWATLPLLGALLRVLWGAEGNSATHRALRIIGNDLGSMRSELARLQAEQTALIDSVRELAAPPIAELNDVGLPPLADPEPEIDALGGFGKTVAGSEAGDAGLGRYASRLLSLLVSSMQPRQTERAG